MYSWLERQFQSLKPIIRESARLVNLTLGRAGFLLPKNQKQVRVRVRNMEHKGGCRSYPPCVVRFPQPLSFTAFGAFPHWLSPPPPRAVQTLWSILPVGADLIPYPHKQSRVASPLFCKQKSKPLTACFWVWFLQITDGANCPEGVQSARADNKGLRER